MRAARSRPCTCGNAPADRRLLQLDQRQLANPYFTSLNTTTGKDDGFLHLTISGNYQYPGAAQPTGLQPAAEPRRHPRPGRGRLHLRRRPARQQIFMLSLGSTATVTGWTSTEFNRPCVDSRAVLPPGGVLVAGRLHRLHRHHRLPSLQPAPRAYPWTGLCDVAAAFPATQTSVSTMWVNYTGCDSLYSTAADSSWLTSAVTSGGPTTRSVATRPGRERSRRPAWLA